jgi:DNA-binding Lrp family transcriptional regulator
MPEKRIPPEVYSFILTYIDSVGLVEALLLLRRNPNRRWLPSEVGTRLYVSESEARNLLERLREDGLVDGVEDAFFYRQQEAALEDAVRQLDESYQKQLVAVTRIIHSKPRRIREFANAFRLRRGRK